MCCPDVCDGKDAQICYISGLKKETIVYYFMIFSVHYPYMVSGIIVFSENFYVYILPFIFINIFHC